MPLKNIALKTTIQSFISQYGAWNSKLAKNKEPLGTETYVEFRVQMKNLEGIMDVFHTDIFAPFNGFVRSTSTGLDILQTR